jgi:L-fuculose-phosphate aldolase
VKIEFYILKFWNFGILGFWDSVFNSGISESIVKKEESCAVDISLVPVGVVVSSLKTRSECPKQGMGSCPEAWIEVDASFVPALHRLEAGEKILVVTWLHQGNREKLQCHPQGNPSLPVHGVFATRSPDRPNPLGLHEVEIRTIQDNRLLVHPLEVIDGTPVVDIKPVLGRGGRRKSDFFSTQERAAVDRLIRAGRDGWQRGLLNGFNGNLSERVGAKAVITATGSAKGHLTGDDFCLVDIATGEHLAGPAPSSESPVHLEVYRNCPHVSAVVHTHPPGLLALDLRVKPGELLSLELFEAGVFRDKLTVVPPMQPGTRELGEAVGRAAGKCPAVLMDRHGLVCTGRTVIEALGLGEEIEALAGIQLQA